MEMSLTFDFGGGKKSWVKGMSAQNLLSYTSIPDQYLKSFETFYLKIL
jgi:hypothetical protein